VFAFACILQRIWSGQSRTHDASTELSRAFRLVFAIHMALLAELDRSAPPKIVQVAAWTLPARLAVDCS